MATDFDAEQFLVGLRESAQADDLGPNDQSMKGLRRPELKKLAGHLDLGVKSNARKSVFLEEVALALVDEGLVSEEFVENVSEKTVTTESVESIEAKAKARETELELKLQKERFELELKQKERALELKQQQEINMIHSEAQAKVAQAEARIKEADAALKEAQARALDQGRNVNVQTRVQEQGFDASRHTRLVPPFQEKDLDAYFDTFEHVANTLKWPTDQWTILLSTVLKNKAQTVYANMDTIDGYNYERVKLYILKAYELVPEAYRRSFRSLKKQDSQTYVEYVRNKERLFEKWCKSHVK